MDINVKNIANNQNVDTAPTTKVEGSGNNSGTVKKDESAIQVETDTVSISKEAVAALNAENGGGTEPPTIDNGGGTEPPTIQNGGGTEPPVNEVFNGGGTEPPLTK